MVGDPWNISISLAPSPTEEVLVDNSAKVKKITFEDNVATLKVNVDALEESDSSEPGQGVHKWLPIAVNTGLASIVGAKYNSYTLTQGDADEATSVGIDAGGFVLYIKTEEVAKNPTTFTLDADGYNPVEITIKIA